MPAQDNKAIVSSFLDQLWSSKDTSVIDNLIDSNYIDHTPPPKAADNLLQGPQTFKDAFAVIQKDFPDLQVSVVDQIVEGDKVVSMLTWRSEALKFNIIGVGIDRINDSGKIVENWNTLDVLYRLVNQLNLRDPLGPAAPEPIPVSCTTDSDCGPEGHGYTCNFGACSRP